MYLVSIHRIDEPQNRIMSDKTIIIVDDEAGIRQLVKVFLERYHFRVLEADSGQALFELLKTADADLIVLDLMLPDVYGIDICKEIRKSSDVPVLMLTAQQGEMNMVLGFEAGADDYVEKPFSAHVLLSRIQAILKRTRGENATWKAPTAVDTDAPDNGEIAPINFKTAHFAKWSYIKEDACLKHLQSGKHAFLTKSECILLELFITQVNKPVEREEIMSALQLAADEVESRAIDVHVSRLRHKLKDRDNTNFIKSIRNKGYEFLVPVTFER